MKSRLPACSEMLWCTSCRRSRQLCLASERILINPKLLRRGDKMSASEGGTAAIATPQRGVPPPPKLKGVSSSAQRVSNHTPPLVQMLALLPPRALQAIVVSVCRALRGFEADCCEVPPQLNTSVWHMGRRVWTSLFSCAHKTLQFL